MISFKWCFCTADGLPDFEFTDYKTEGGQFSISTVVLNMLIDLVENEGLKNGQKIVNAMREMINALKDDPKGKFSKVYSTFHNLARKNSFDFGLMDEDPVGHLPVITSFAYELEVVESGLDILWLKLPKDSNKLKIAP